MAGPALREDRGRLLLRVHVTSGAARTETIGIDSWTKSLRIHVMAPAKRGASNRELVQYLSNLLNLPSSAVQVTRGLTNRWKIISIVGIEMGDALQRLTRVVE